MAVTDLIARLDGTLRDISEGIDPEAHHALPMLDDWICLRDGQIPRIWGRSSATAPTGILTGPILRITWDSAAVRALEGWYRLAGSNDCALPPTPPSAPRARLSLPAFRARVHVFAAEVERLIQDADQA